MPVTISGVTTAGATNKTITSALVTKSGITFVPGGAQSEVQVLGSLIGTGLSDTGTADVTNLLVSTQQAFAGIDWISTAITPSDTGVTAPDSTTTASTLTETTANSHHVIAQGFLTAASAASYTFAVSLKQGLRTRAALVIRDSTHGDLSSTNFAFVTFDLAGGAIGVAASVGGTFTAQSATITAKSNGFYLCTLTATTSGLGMYDVEVYPDSGSGSGSSSLSYVGNAGSIAISLWGAGVWAGAAGTYTPLNANGGAAGSTIQQAFVRNGTTTAYWGTQTPNAYVGYDAGVKVVFTRHRFAPRPSAKTALGQWPLAPDYAQAIAGAVVQTDVADSTFASPTTVDTFPAVNVNPYYPRHWLSERSIPAGAASRYIRFKPSSVSFGGLSEWQVFALAGTTANACPVQPVITPMGGRFPGLSVTVSMSSLTGGAQIYYTVGKGSIPADPTTASTLYTGPFTQTIGGGATVYIKAIANLASLSTPSSLVTTSAPFYGYGLKPNDDWYDDKGNLLEAHAGSAPVWDPNTQAYYLVGQFMNINNVLHFSATVEPNYAPAVFLYKSTDLINWTNLGSILNDPFPLQPIAGNYNLLYNSANNNYVIWTSVVDASNNSTGYYAITSGSNILGPWTWNTASPIVSNTFFNFATMIDSDGVSAYVVWRPTILGTSIQKLNSTYTGLTGSALTLTNSVLREGFAFFKSPNTAGGTYFLVTGAANPYDSTANIDLRYITNAGASPTANSWSAVPSAGSAAFASSQTGTNFNGQAFASCLAQGKTQPFITMDFWVAGNLYASRQVWLPLVLTSTTLQIQVPSTWTPALLAGTNLNTLQLSANTFAVGNAQGTVIGTVNGTTATSTLTLTDSHSGAVQLVSGVIQVGATAPGATGTFNIQLTETLAGYPNSPNVTWLTIIENASSPSLSGSVATSTAQVAINLTSLGTTDWIAWAYNSVSTFDRKATGGSKISTPTQVGGISFSNFNYGSTTPNWNSSWTDGTTTGTVMNEAFMNFVSAAVSGDGMSFTVPADTTTRTLKVYLGLASGTPPGNCKLTATLSDSSAGPYTDTSVSEGTTSTNLMAVYTITYAAASSAQTLTVSWLWNATHTGNVVFHAAALS